MADVVQQGSLPVTVTIVTPCYNGAAFLAQTLRSALTQSRPPLEILVVDDGSTDESAAIAESFGTPVRVVRQTNQGESMARNRALAEALGSHVLFLDADDLLEPTSLERLSAAVVNAPGAVALMGCAWFSDDPSAPYATHLPDQPAFFPSIIESNLAPPHCWLTPTQLVRRAGGFCAEMRWFEDWDLWWRVGLLGPPLVAVRHFGALYRRHPNSQLATTRRADQARGHAQLMARMANAFLKRPDLMSPHGEQVFWSSFTALRRAREAGVPWRELESLSAALLSLAERATAATRRSRAARAMRWFGVKTAARMYGAIARSGA